MKLCKKLVLCLLAVAVVLLCFTALPGTAQAASKYYVQYEYDREKAGYIITDVSGEHITAYHYDVPSSYNGAPVIAIDDGAFVYQEFTSVTIPYSVKSIGDAAFKHCYNLKYITLPNEITHIGSNLFGHCENVRFEEYGNGLYIGSSNNPYLALIGPVSEDITSCKVHPYTKIIADRAFALCDNLVTLTIPEGLQIIGYEAFWHCTALTELTIPNSVTTIDEGAFDGCTSLKSVTIGKVVKDLGLNVFRGCTAITDVTIVSGATQIGTDAFAGCTSLTNVTITNSVTAIGDGAFYGCSSLQNIAIPNKVTTIGESAFAGCTGLTSVTIPDSVTTIKRAAFSDCTSLKSVTLSKKTASIGSGAFGSCAQLKDVYISDIKAWYKIAFEDGKANPLNNGAKLHLNGELVTDLVFPDNATAISDNVFNGCTSLTNVTIPSNVTTIGQGAFYGNTSLESITIPDSVITIGESAFYGCSSAKSVTLGKKVADIGIDAFGECPEVKDVYISDLQAWCKIVFNGQSANPLNSGAKLYLKGELVTDVKIPEGLTKVPDYVFFGCTSLKSVTIPDGVTHIGMFAFTGCKGLTSLTIPESVTDIQMQAFVGCTGLTSLALPENIKSVQMLAFAGCTGLKSLTISDKGHIDSSAFKDCLIEKVIIAEGSDKITEAMLLCVTTAKEIVIPASVTSIDPKAFAKCKNLASIQMDEGNFVYHIAGNCVIETDSKVLVSGCANSQIPADGSVAAIGDYAFNGVDGLKNITIPDSVTSIGNYAFTGASDLESITISDSVTTIGIAAFNNCTGLTEISLGNGVTSIGKNAFYNCTSLKSITIPDSVTSIEIYPFVNCSSLTKVVFGKGLTSVPYYAFNGCVNLTEVILSDSITEIRGGAFGGCTSLESIDLPEGLTVIEYEAFKDCTSLKNINFPDCGTAIGGSTFQNCTSLTSITITKSAGASAFSGCTGLKSVTISDGVTAIGQGTFWGCTSLTSISLPDSVTVIHNNAFRNCTSLTDIHIPDGVTSIGSGAFYGCAGLTDITIPEGITTIYRETIYGCAGLTSIVIPGSVTTVERDVFDNCSSLQSVVIPGSVITLHNSAFSGCTSLHTMIYCGTQTQWDALERRNSFSLRPTATLQFRSYENGVCEYCQYYDASSVLVYTSNSFGDGYIILDCNTIVGGNLEIPESYNGKPVVGIGENAFADCADLTGITIGQNITAIGKNAFAGCTALTEVFYKGTQEQWAAMVIDGENQVLLSALFHHSCTDAVNHWQMQHVEPTCTEAGYQYETCSCGYERNKVTEGAATGHSWVEANCAAPKTCSVCQLTEGSANTDTHILGQWETVKIATPVASGQRKRTCPCGHSVETEELLYAGNGIVLTGELAQEKVVYLNGLPYEVKADGEGWYVELPKAKELLLVTYTYHEGDGQDVHTQYPTGMKVYLVKDGKITHIPELDDLLQYSGSSIRITGKKGIRMITSIDKDKKTALTGKGLAGYTVVEYGTTLCFANEIPEGDGLILGRSYARSNYAYKRGVADPVFATTKDLVQYTNVLVGFSLDQCKDDIAMRPYIILKNANGEQFTIYGGTIYRSIGYIAYQNRSVFQPKTASYNFVWEIIHHVYGDKYDADYKG